MTALQWYSRLCRIIDENRHPSEVKFQRAQDRRLARDAAMSEQADVAAILGATNRVEVPDYEDDDPGD